MLRTAEATVSGRQLGAGLDPGLQLAASGFCLFLHLLVLFPVIGSFAWLVVFLPVVEKMAWFMFFWLKTPCKRLSMISPEWVTWPLLNQSPWVLSGQAFEPGSVWAPPNPHSLKVEIVFVKKRWVCYHKVGHWAGRNDRRPLGSFSRSRYTLPSGRPGWLWQCPLPVAVCE